MAKAPVTTWKDDQLFCFIHREDFFTANANLVATGNVLGQLTSMRQYPGDSTDHKKNFIMLSAQDYAVAQIALKGIDHIEATAKKITKIRNAEADDAHRPRHDLSDFLRARNSYGDESSTAVMTPKTEA